MSMTFLEAMGLWDEFMGPASNPTHCGLCGNSGIIDTVGKIQTAAVYECGIRAPCLCPNGRAIKRHQERDKPKPPPPQTFWVSWEDTSGKALKKLPGSRILGVWCSGYSDDAECIVAWVKAKTVGEVVVAVEAEWPSKEERRWRFLSPCEKGWTPGDRFPLSKWMQARARRLK